MQKRGICSRKAQLTAFILIGMVVLIIFGFMFTISGQIQQSEVQSDIDIAAEKISKTNIIKQNVNICLKDALKEGLIQAGRQGGVVGIPISYFKYNGKIGYGVKDNIQGPYSAGIPGPPKYPCINQQITSSYPCSPTSEYPTAPFNQIYPKKLFPWGKENLPALCSPTGPNAVYLNLFPYPCPSGTYGLNSLQDQLNGYIKLRLTRCLDVVQLERITGLNIDNGTPNASVLIGEEDIIARATYPLNISLGNQRSTRFFDFEVSLPVRIKKMFGLADYIAKKEVFELDFVTEDDYVDFRYFGKQILPKMNVSRYCPLCGTAYNPEYVDIVEINDTVSIIDGKPFMFRFAIENRIPALDPILDISIYEGETISIHPQAYDPDEDDIITYSASDPSLGTFSYSGGYLSAGTSIGDAGSYSVDVMACDKISCDWQPVQIEIMSVS